MPCANAQAERPDPRTCREGHRVAEPAVVDGEGEARDATRRTRLATERTYLAWWRTGLTALAVSVAAGKLLPELASGAAWPYQTLGAAFALVGLLFIAYAHVRQQRVEKALARGDYAPFDSRAGLIFTGLGLVLGVGTIAVIFAGPANS
jgi:putative membrane protein